MNITVDGGGAFEREGVLHIDIAFYLAPEIYIVACECADDRGILADDHTALGVNLALHSTVYADVGQRGNLSLDDRPR